MSVQHGMWMVIDIDPLVCNLSSSSSSWIKYLSLSISLFRKIRKDLSSSSSAAAAAGSCCRPVIWTNWLALMLTHPLHYINPSRILQLDSRLGCWKVTLRWRSGHRARRRRRHHHSEIFLVLLITAEEAAQLLKHETARRSSSSAGAACSCSSSVGNRNRRAARSAGEPSGQYGSYGQ